MIAGLTPEFIAILPVLFAATLLAVYMAARPHKALPVEDQDEMADVFTQDVLPMFEESNAELVAKLRKAALELGAKNPDGITADDIHDVCPIPPGVDPRIMGSAFEKGLWIKAGWTATRRKSAHSRPVRIWKRKGRMI